MNLLLIFSMQGPDCLQGRYLKNFLFDWKYAERVKEFKMLVKNTILMACTTLALAACGTSAPSQHAHNSPPRMIHHVHNNYSYMWDYADRFAAIPAEQSERAVRECNKYKVGSVPIGYAPQALDIAGFPIAGGAFSCRD